jgi:hypothetical protein
MDQRQFEALTRRISRAVGRRGAIKAVVAAIGVPLLVRGHAEEAAAGVPIVNCKPSGKRCDADKKCCSGNCRKGICSCKKRGEECWEPLEGSLCCSQRCSSGKCA